jgi:hypothetical protein
MAQTEVLTNELQFHLLRHFTSVDEDYLQWFISVTEYTREDIRKQLEIKGSRFFYAFAPNPLVLWEKAMARVRAGSFELTEERGRQVYSINFGESSYPDGIGLCYLVDLRELDENEKASVRNEPRGDHLVQVVRGINPRVTREMQLVEVLNEEPYVSTIFPGTYAPPFPDEESQDREEFLRNTGFWKNHAIIGD